jgi:hypothetical protein
VKPTGEQRTYDMCLLKVWIYKSSYSYGKIIKGHCQSSGIFLRIDMLKEQTKNLKHGALHQYYFNIQSVKCNQ